jgi:hypothetical protein
MKNLVRAFVLSLVVTGVYASAQINNAAQPVLSAKVSALPIPSCPPNDPDGCHILDGQKPSAK